MKLYVKSLALEYEMFELLHRSYASGITEDEQVALGEQRMALAEKEKEEKISFIKGNPSSYAAKYFLRLLTRVCERCLWGKRCKEPLILPCVQK